MNTKKSNELFRNYFEKQTIEAYSRQRVAIMCALKWDRQKWHRVYNGYTQLTAADCIAITTILKLDIFSNG